MTSPFPRDAGAAAKPDPAMAFQGAHSVADPTRVVIAAAGDISCAPDPAGVGSEERNSPVRCQDAATADLVSAVAPDAVLTLGDHQYPNASIERFRGGYDRTWGRFKEITHPAVGNHEYGTRAASGYFDYFGAAAGDPVDRLLQLRPRRVAPGRAQLRVQAPV